MIAEDLLRIGKTTFSSRLFLGTGKFGSKSIMSKSIDASGSELVTVALKRVDTKDSNDSLLSHVVSEKVSLLPNTSGARDVQEAVLMAELAREAFQTDFIKLEIHPDAKYLMPDAIETLKATEILAKKGFVVLPYIHADPVLCKRLENAGTSAVMPLGSPIGSNKGVKTKDFIEIIVEQSNVPVVVDAGIGRPSDACVAMEIGADAVLVNTAIATAQNPTEIAKAFKAAVEAGRNAYLNGIPELEIGLNAQATSPLIGFLD